MTEKQIEKMRYVAVTSNASTMNSINLDKFEEKLQEGYTILHATPTYDAVHYVLVKYK